MQSAGHRTYRVSPGAMVFNRDMLVPILLLINFDQLRQQRQVVIDKNARKQNLKRKFYDYHIGDQVFIRVKDPTTLQERNEGPYVVHEVHINGTVTIWRNEIIMERINIRRLHPCHTRD